MDTFYGEHFKAIFDFANFVQAGEDTIKAYALLKEYISYLHVKDAFMVNGSVVPAGFGDGHVKEILADLFASGFELLERDGKSIQSAEKKELDGAQAFTLAYESLMKILPKEA